MFFEDSEKHGISISSGVRIVICTCEVGRQSNTDNRS